MDIIIEKLDNLKESVDNNTRYFKDVSSKVYKKLQLTEKVLLRAIMDATEVTVPTTFIILPQKIKKKKNDGNEKDADEIVRFIESLASTWKNATALIGYDVVYMYLIDEYTGKPVIPDTTDEIYPIPINVITDGGFLESISPYLAIGFKFVSIANSIAGMLQIFGYPIPTIPINSSTEAFIKSFADGNSVGDQNGNTNVRGAALRKLEKFFTDKDRNGTFCQLRRVVAARTGYCMWTTEENFKKMESDVDDDDNLFAEIVKNKNDTNHNAGTEIDQQSSLSSNNNHNTSTSTEEVEAVNSNYCNSFCCSSCRNICCTCYG